MEGRSVLKDWESPEWALSRRACELDDTTLLGEAISQSATGAENQKNFYNQLRRHAIKHNAKAVLDNLVERGVEITPQSTYEPVGASIETLELLLAHGWDINGQFGNTSSGGKPFMWFVASDENMVEWCLEHGASVHPRHPQRCPPILELVAESGTISTYKRLLGMGAPTGRSLHLAIEAATYGVPTKETDKREYAVRMEMVRYLIDEVGLDVNEDDQPEGRRLPMRNGTPICYVPGSAMLERDTRELTWFLLDHGADPTPALEIAKSQYPQFVEDVEAWKAERKAGERQCCVQ